MSKGKKTRVETGEPVEVTTTGDTDFHLQAAEAGTPVYSGTESGVVTEIARAEVGLGANVEVVDVTVHESAVGVVTSSLAHEANYVMHCARRLRTIATIAGENPELASALTKLDEAETWLTRAFWRAGQA